MFKYLHIIRLEKQLTLNNWPLEIMGEISPLNGKVNFCHCFERTTEQILKNTVYDRPEKHNQQTIMVNDKI